MNNINFTFIIPHKNIPHLLSRCVNSIPRRDDIQIIIVDDNSDEKKVDFNNFPGINENNVEVYFTKEGKGAGYARNVGLKYAKGEWILFADADDYFSPEILDICDRNNKTDIDLVVFNSKSVISNSLKEIPKREKATIQYTKCFDENILRYSSHVVWGKIFKTKMINIYNIKFDEISAANDVYFAALSGLYSKKIVFDQTVGYVWTVRDGSISTNLSILNLKAHINTAYKFNNLLFANNIPIKYYINILGLLKRLYKVDKIIFTKEFIRYLTYIPMKRIFMDISQSLNNYLTSY